MKKLNKILWGIVLLAVGAAILLKSFNILDFSLLFKGWWTLFIILPCFIGLLTQKDKLVNAFGLILGVLLLLACRSILSFSVIWTVFLALIVIFAGLKLIFGSSKSKDNFPVTAKVQNPKKSCAVFSGNDIDFSGQIFSGADLAAVFGGIECDLSNAVFESDTVINAAAVFGGIDIILPKTVNLKINSASFCGGVDAKRHTPIEENEVTVYLNASGIFGGIDVKNSKN